MHPRPTLQLDHVRTIALAHDGECGLLGVGPDLQIYVEEIYGEDGWMAQSAYDFEGRLLDSVDEAHGENVGAERMQKPGSLVRPGAALSALALNFGGARHRGLLAEDRVQEVSHPLETADKFLLVEESLLPPLAPPSILGIAQSYVTSEVLVLPPGSGSLPLFLLSRRLRVAYRLPQPATDEAGDVYDYDTHEVSVLQRFQPGGDGQPLQGSLLSQAELGVALNWASDLVLRDEYLFVADAARLGEGLHSRVHVWHLSVL